jgi:hypothetical protein
MLLECPKESSRTLVRSLCIFHRRDGSLNVRTFDPSPTNESARKAAAY